MAEACSGAAGMAELFDAVRLRALPCVELVQGPGIRPHYRVACPGEDGQRFEVFEAGWFPPAYPAGLVRVLDVGSFAEYMKLHATTATIVACSIDNASVTATLDWHNPRGEAGRGEHHLRLECRRTPEWESLRKMSGKQVSQEAFADFLDELAHVFETPSADRLKDIVLNLEGARDVSWQSKLNRVSGGVQIEYTEVAAAKTKSGIVFPERGTAVLSVYEGGPPVQVLVEFRYRVKDGNLTVGLAMSQVARIEREAFLGTCKQVEEATGTTVLLGP